jgi:hypothetical protein
MHLGHLVFKRGDFILHPLDLYLGQLSTECLDFIPQTLDPAPILAIGSGISFFQLARPAKYFIGPGSPWKSPQNVDPSHAKP